MSINAANDGKQRGSKPPDRCVEGLSQVPALPACHPAPASFLKYWLPVLLWMGVVFSFSGDSSSFQHSSRVVRPILLWLFPHLSDEAIHAAVLLVRKCAHVTEYGILGWLLWRALRRPARNDPRPWAWPVAGCALLLAALYAATDEFHQAFVPTREASVVDVLIDAAGAALGLLLLWGIHSRRSRRKDCRRGKPIAGGEREIRTPGEV